MRDTRALSAAASSLSAHMERVAANGITDERLLTALRSVRHEQFVPVDQIHLAWGTHPLPLPCGQMMPAPTDTARLIEALALTGSETVLDVGTGSGYQAVLLSLLARKVHSVDRYRTLVGAASRIAGSLERDNLTFSQGDVLAPDFGKGSGLLYDRIVADASFPDTPRDLIDRLASGGIVVAPIVAASGEVHMTRLTKVGSRFQRESLFETRATPLEPGVAASL